MSLKASFTFTDNTKKTEDGVSEVIRRFVGRSLLVMEANIKILTPIKTGNLARSITQKQTSDSAGEVFTNPMSGGKAINYAAFVEFGTKYMAPRGMFRKGVEAAKPQIIAIYKEEADKMHDPAS